MMVENILRPGLEGVVAAQTRLSCVDGQAGQLWIGGFPLEELAGKATLEEVIHLLWHDRLPNAIEWEQLRAQLCALRKLPSATLQVLEVAAQQKLSVMDALLMATGTLHLSIPKQKHGDSRYGAALLVACFPLIIAAYWRLREGKDLVDPHPSLDNAANYLYMLSGEEPQDEKIQGLTTYLTTVADHGLNASTFAARVIISTESDIVSAIAGAVGALKGPLHGGAPGPVLDMLREIGETANIESYLLDKMERGERLMGFGHRVYKVRDPRAEVLSHAARRVCGGDTPLYKLACEVEQKAVEILARYKPGRKLETNVEFYTALLLHGLGLPQELFSATFAIGRVVGWTAHCCEQQQNNRIFRPKARYSGMKTRRWKSLEERE